MVDSHTHLNRQTGIVYKLESIGYSAVIQSTGDVEMEECRTCRLIVTVGKNLILGLTIGFVWVAAIIGIITIAGGA